MVGQLLALWWPQALGRGISAELPASEKFFELFSTCFEKWTWNLVNTSGGWYDTSSLSFIVVRSFWPTLQPKVDQVRFSTHGLINYMKPPTLALTLIKWVFWPILIFAMAGQFFALGVWNIQKGESLVQSPWFPASGKFSRFFFSICSSYQLESLFIHSAGRTTYWVHILPE